MSVELISTLLSIFFTILIVVAIGLSGFILLKMLFGGISSHQKRINAKKECVWCKQDGLPYKGHDYHDHCLD